MPITRARSNVIGVARLCAKYVNTASEVKFHVQSGTDETKNNSLLWKPVEARKISLKSAQPQMIWLKAFSHDLRKKNGRNRIRTTWKTRSALASSQFKMTVLPVVTGFLYRLRTQTIIRQKVYCKERSRSPNPKKKTNNKPLTAQTQTITGNGVPVPGSGFSTKMLGWAVSMLKWESHSNQPNSTRHWASKMSVLSPWECWHLEQVARW